jgi:hypothetical protein
MFDNNILSNHDRDHRDNPNSRRYYMSDMATVVRHRGSIPSYKEDIQDLLYNNKGVLFFQDDSSLHLGYKFSK